MATVRAMLISRAALLIVDSGNPDLSAQQIAAVLNGATETNPGLRRYHEHIELGSRSEKLLMSAVRKAVLKHPRYKNSKSGESSNGE